MRNVDTIDGVYIRQAQQSASTTVFVRANGLWYLVPVQPGGWVVRQLLTRRQVGSNVPTLKQLGAQEMQRLWDIVREPPIKA